MVYYLINRVVDSGHRVFVDTRGVWAQYHIIKYIENAERSRYPLHGVPIYYNAVGHCSKGVIYEGLKYNDSSHPTSSRTRCA